MHRIKQLTTFDGNIYAVLEKDDASATFEREQQGATCARVI